MLEHSSLHVTCWAEGTLADSTPAWLRRVTDAAARPLGFVRLVGNTRRSWFSWLRGVRLDVYETADESHLMTVVRPWGILRSWDVYDAEDRHVGSVCLPSLLDSEGQRRGVLNMRDRGHGTIRDGKNIVLASFRTSPVADLEVTFQPEPDANPFLRMLLLAAVLALGAEPQE